MTQPRIVQRDIEPTYHGQFATTRLEEHQVTGPDGSVFVASLYHVVDADRDPELLRRLGDGTLNQAVCPNTGQLVTLDLPVVVHSPEAQLVILVIPANRRHEQIKLRIELLASLDQEPGTIPSYVLDFKTVFGSFGPAELEALTARVEVSEDLEAERRRQAELAVANASERARLGEWAEELEEADRALRHSQVSIRLADDDSDDGPTDVLGGPDAGAPPIDDLATLDPAEDEKTAVQFSSPYADLVDSLEMLTSSDIEIIEAEPALRLVPAPEPETPDEPTRRVAEPAGPDKPILDDLANTSATEPNPIVTNVSPAPAPEPLGQAVDMSELAIGGVRKLLAGDRPAFHFAVGPERLNAFLRYEVEPFVQLHRLPSYPILSILLTTWGDSGVPHEELYVTFDVLDADDQELLERLADACTFEVHLYDGEGQRVHYQAFRLQLERNVQRLVEGAESWLSEHSGAADLAAARTIFDNEGYERLGARKHNFHRNSFAQITTASAARLAVGMVGYWSEEQNLEYLVENRSFPIDHFRAIQDRVIQSAVRFGIFMTPELRQRAVALKLAKSERDLIEMLIERFYEATHQGGPSDLDQVVQAENWDLLLAGCVDLGGVVDERVTDLAAKIRRRAHRNPSSPKTHLDELSKTSEYKRPSSLDEISNEELQSLLVKGGVAPAVSRELVGRGGATNIFHVIEGARVLDEDGLMATARFLAAGADAFEPALLMGLGRIHLRTVHLCALALAMAKRVEALPTLIELLHDRERRVGLPIRDIVAEYGAAAIPALFDAIEKRGATDELIEVLACISVDAGPAIIGALRERPTAALLEAAQRMSEVRRRLGGRKAGSLPGGEDSSADEETVSVNESEDEDDS